ncbi:eukaryotic phosphomannomutase [Hygrophoropsis aurantiaca]|uniref:Eukaryotic phosphomannomutase n=1 Tax=Hygrophoropsis aurantiaca TaxID=72124 RepID=A0ACB8AE70_9AGAM|nr:eukaryotic phosphomannomutase [Hygrophoropsis aurantiaca]
MASVSLAPRPLKKLVLFDVDGPLTLARQKASEDIIKLLLQLKEKLTIGFVGGSDLGKITEQLSVHGHDALKLFDFGFAENGLTAYRFGELLASQSFIKYVGETDYKELVKFILHYVADLDIPIKRGTFIEFRNGMINVSPIGRNASIAERIEFEAYDKIHKVRAAFIEKLKAKFAHLKLTFAIGGQISFDVYPNGWDKTYCLRHIPEDQFEEIHFIGDKTYPGGNDYELFSHPRTVGHTVINSGDTIDICTKLFLGGKA